MTNSTKALTTSIITSAITSALNGDKKLTTVLQQAMLTSEGQTLLSTNLMNTVSKQRLALAKLCGHTSYTNLMKVTDLMTIDYLVTLLTEKSGREQSHNKIKNSLKGLDILDDSERKERPLIKAMLNKPEFNRSFKFDKKESIFSFEVKADKKEKEASTKDDADYFQKIVELFQKIEDKELYKTKLTQVILNESSEKVVEQKTTSKQKTQITINSTKARYVNKCVADNQASDTKISDSVVRDSATTSWELNKVEKALVA